MPTPLKHDMFVPGNRDQAARQDFVTSLRAYILNDLASSMRNHYFADIEPNLARQNGGEAPSSGPAVHDCMKKDSYFRAYSSLRYNTQEMVWRTVAHPIWQNKEHLSSVADPGDSFGGSLTLDEALDIPRNVSALDVHLAPGSYHREDPEAPWMAGAIYDHGLNVFSFGMMGQNLDDIGQSMSQYIKHKYPEFAPAAVLDLGCTVGHNTCAWKQTYPEARVTGIDVAPACLRYGHARAVNQRIDVDFRQMNAASLDFPDASFDVVFSSMFLHELSVKDIKRVFKEARRVLKPGGLMLHMELPPNDSLEPFDAFYLDWDAYYNNEPFYKTFRDQNFTALRTEAGFPESSHLQFITPQYTYMSPEAYAEAVQHEQGFSDKTGRLAEGIQWFGFGAWRPEE